MFLIVDENYVTDANEPEIAGKSYLAEKILRRSEL